MFYLLNFFGNSSIEFEYMTLNIFLPFSTILFFADKTLFKRRSLLYLHAYHVEIMFLTYQGHEERRGCFEGQKPCSRVFAS